MLAKWVGLCDGLLMIIVNQLVSLNKGIISSDKQFPLLASNARAELERDMDYILKGLDKLYTASNTLTRDQVKQSSEMANDRLAKKVIQVKEKIEKQREDWTELGRSFIQQAVKAVDDALGPEWNALQSSVSHPPGSLCNGNADPRFW